MEVLGFGTSMLSLGTNGRCHGFGSDAFIRVYDLGANRLSYQVPAHMVWNRRNIYNKKECGVLDQLNSSKQSLSSAPMCINNNANKRIIQSKKILRKSRARVVRKSCGHNYYPPKVLAAKSIAERIVKKRTKMLKSLVPGGKSMDDVAIIKEALDYILSLQFQVNIMHCSFKLTSCDA